MTAHRSRDDLKAFLDWVGAKGLMPLPTVRSRKAAVNMILDILSEDEAQDVTNLDVPSVITRFGNLRGKNYTPASMRSYQSRLQKTLDDFAAYVENPMAFKPGSPSRQARSRSKATPLDTANKPEPSRPAISAPIAAPAANILPIPVRADLTIHVQGIPFDLTRGEAQRIANVILAMANDPGAGG